MKNTFLFILLSMISFSCEKAILGEPEMNTQENNFELLWNDFDKNYGLFNARGWSWDSIYTLYRPQVNDQTSDEELWDIFKDMISYLDDSHTFIYNPDVDFFASGSEQDDLVEAEFSLALLKNKYLENIEDLNLTDSEDESYVAAKIQDKNIGYIYMSGIEADDEDFIDGVLNSIGQHDAIIFDIRNNTGGDDAIGASIAGRFADGEHLVYTVQTRNGPNHNDFSDPVSYSTEVQGQENYRKPIIILTDKITVSAAETMLFHFKAFDLVTQIGDTTAGDFSDVSMRRFLPNGWQYQYSIMQYLKPNGESLDGIGHIPFIQVRNSINNIEMQEDIVMEQAINFLFDEYEIE